MTSAAALKQRSSSELRDAGPPRSRQERAGGARSSPSARSVAVLAAAVTALVLLLEVFVAPPALWGGRDNPGAWNPPRNRAELLVAKMDGHTFAEIASDPTMAHAADAYFGEKANAAYRSSRPVQGWVDYLASAGGQRVLLAPAILVLTALAVGAAVWSTALLGLTLGRRVRWLGAVLATPAFVAAIAYPGICEPLAIVLTLGGVAAWLRSRPWLAVGLLTGAALTRETMLLVPLGLGLAHLISNRRVVGVLKLAIPAVAYLAWIQVVHARIGAWPSDYAQTGGLGVGFRAGFPHWHLAEWLTAALIVASVVVIVLRGTNWMKAITALHLPLLAVANYQVWWVWLGFGRVAMLLPLFALISLGRPLVRPTGNASSSGGSYTATAGLESGTPI